MDLRPLSPEFSVAPQISTEDLAEIARLGYRTVINNRPDDEVPGQPRSADIEAEACAAGLAYRFQPVISGGITLEDVHTFRELLAGAEGPVLAFCRSGTRCTNLWALAQAGECNAAEVIATAARAGYDLSGMRQILEQGLPRG